MKLVIAGMIVGVCLCACANTRQPPANTPEAAASPTPQPRRFLAMPMGRGIGAPP
ncbi:MAG: hypothetical protein ACREQ4_15430 [Candidatus Binataceae bacterium]